MSHDVMWPIGEERKKMAVQNLNYIQCESSSYWFLYRLSVYISVRFIACWIHCCRRSLCSKPAALSPFDSICLHHQIYKLWSVQLDNTLQKSSINQIGSLGEMRKNADPGSGSASIYCGSAPQHCFFSFFFFSRFFLFSNSLQSSSLSLYQYLSSFLSLLDFFISLSLYLSLSLEINGGRTGTLRCRAPLTSI